MKGFSKKHLIILALTVGFMALNFYRIYKLENGVDNILTQGTEVHFIDVGQGDSALILSGGEAVLIDGGTNQSEQALITYLKTQGVKEFKMVIATHPHEDHIGGLDEVLRSFPTENVVMTEQTSTSATYGNLLDAIEETETKVTIAEPGQKLTFASGAYLTILAPSKGEKFKETNDYSVVSRLDAGENSVLFTGDLEEAGEKSMLMANTFITADILKVGHHGSNTSSKANFLRIVKPEQAIISVGKDNKYGHPHPETLATLASNKIPYQTTAEEGTIVFKFEAKTDE